MNHILKIPILFTVSLMFNLSKCDHENIFILKYFPLLRLSGAGLTRSPDFEGNITDKVCFS